MQRRRSKHIFLVLAVVVSSTLLLSSQYSRAQADQQDEAPDETPVPDRAESTEGYPVEQRRYGTSLDPISRLNENLPQTDSLIDWSLPKSFTDFKTRLHEKHGLKLGFSYQSLYQKASDSLTDTDSAWGGWFLINVAWTAVNRGEAREGKVVLSLDGRHIINPSTHTAPGLFSLDTGSLWPTDGAFLEWGVYPAVFFWEQHIEKGAFAFRVGQQATLSVIDPYRFDEQRNAFTGSVVTSPISMIPLAPPGLSFSAKWWPMKATRLYVSGIVSDINAPDGEVDWSGLFDEGEVFAAVEVGHNWIRGKADYDHAHLTMWYADEVSTAAWDTKAGWGAKVSGNKQWDRFVAMGYYAYNTAEGGGLGTTNTRHAVNAGMGYLKPLGIRGEAALAFSWGDPITAGLRSQFGVEAYWRILIFSNLWLTPGVQHLVNPTFNSETDGITIAQIKLSFFI